MKSKRLISTILGMFILTIGLTSCFYQPHPQRYGYDNRGYNYRPQHRPQYRPHPQRVVVKPAPPVRHRENYRSHRGVRSNQDYRAGGNRRYN